MKIDTRIQRLGDEELLARVKQLVVRSNETEADLIAHLAEVDARKLFLPRRTSLWDFCLLDLGFSESVAAGRIAVARESRRHPRILEILRAGRIHLSGLRLVCPHLGAPDGDALLDAAAGKSKREIEMLLARRSPKPAVPDRVRRLLSPGTVSSTASAASADAAAAMPLLPGVTETAAAPTPGAATVSSGWPAAPSRRTVVAPLSGDSYRVQYTASAEQWGRIEQARDLNRHRLPSGDLATLIDLAVTLLVEQGLKQRFAVGRKPRTSAAQVQGPARSRRVPAALAREVYARDGGRCAFVDPDGQRCDATGMLQIDHVDGFARTREHRLESLRLACASHNQHAADVMYGKRWMDRKRAKPSERRVVKSLSPGTVDFAIGDDSRGKPISASTIDDDLAAAADAFFAAALAAV